MLVGELNPYGGGPEFALYPAPDGCSGHRLCCLVLGMRRTDYLRVFHRINLCDGKWSLPAARRKAAIFRTHPAPMILLGAKVARAFEFDPFEPFTVADGGNTLVLPHPSGLCRLWNESGAFERAQMLVRQVPPDIGYLLGIYDRRDED